MTDDQPDFERWLAWTRRQMPVTRRQVERLPDLSGMRLVYSGHLTLNGVPALEGLRAAGCDLFLLTCNPSTVRQEVVSHLEGLGAKAHVWSGMPASEVEAGLARALRWRPTHACEMGADFTCAAHASGVTLQGSLEATASGISRLRRLTLRYPVFDWDGVPLKTTLHNRHMVGLTTWWAFLYRTRLSLHGRRVVVVGYGEVGKGVADAARAFGGAVSVAEVDPARALAARWAGWETAPLAELAPRADVLVTATGRPGVVGREVVERLPDGCFLVNVGHSPDEIDVEALGERRQVLPHVELCAAKGREIYLFAGGAMANLTAGQGDSLNSFDATSAVMVAGVGFLADLEGGWPAGIHPLPEAVWQPCAEGVEF